MQKNTRQSTMRLSAALFVAACAASRSGRAAVAARQVAFAGVGAAVLGICAAFIARA